MTILAINKVSGRLKNKGFKNPNAPCSTRCVAFNKERIMRFYFILICMILSMIAIGQEYSPQEFKYNRTDSAICNGQIKRISYINDIDTSEYYIKYKYDIKRNNTEVTTGYLKSMIPFNEFKIYNSDGQITYSLDYDTIPIGYKEIRKILAKHHLSSDTLDVYYGHSSDFVFKHEVGKWIVFTKNYSAEYDYLLIDGITGVVTKSKLDVLENPVYLKNNYSISPKFTGGEKGLNEYLTETSKYKIVQYGDNAVWVKFTVTKRGTVKYPRVICTESTFYNNEALRLVNLMPKWIPAEDKDGKRIEVEWKIKINFGKYNATQQKT